MLTEKLAYLLCESGLWLLYTWWVAEWSMTSLYCTWWVAEWSMTSLYMVSGRMVTWLLIHGEWLNGDLTPYTWWVAEWSMTFLIHGEWLNGLWLPYTWWVAEWSMTSFHGEWLNGLWLPYTWWVAEWSMTSLYMVSGRMVYDFLIHGEWPKLWVFFMKYLWKLMLILKLTSFSPINKHDKIKTLTHSPDQRHKSHRPITYALVRIHQTFSRFCNLPVSISW